MPLLVAVSVGGSELTTVRRGLAGTIEGLEGTDMLAHKMMKDRRGWLGQNLARN